MTIQINVRTLETKMTGFHVLKPLSSCSSWEKNKTKQKKERKKNQQPAIAP